MTRKLSEILADLISGRTVKDELSGGLMFQYHAPESENPVHRLFCYRRGDTPPSTHEFMVLRRELEKLLSGRRLVFGSLLRYMATDKVSRTGNVFSWLPDEEEMALLRPPAQQLGIDFDQQELARPVRYE
ncbi:MAG: hypothetical protein H6658_19045 [Ardenticatenaceae bacterium]|nr:hypothetical protein [Ardenticatenaceae bacterium]